MYDNRDLLIGKKVILFVMGDYIGKDNSFENVKEGLPLEKYCTQKQLDQLVAMGCELAWHTWSHRDLTTLTKEEIIKEITPPVPMKKLAYPYGRFNSEVLEAVREVGFEEAFSVTQGDNSQFQRTREYVAKSND